MWAAVIEGASILSSSILAVHYGMLSIQQYGHASAVGAGGCTMGKARPALIAHTSSPGWTSPHLQWLVKLVILEAMVPAPWHGRARPEQKHTPAKAPRDCPFQEAASHSAARAVARPPSSSSHSFGVKSAVCAGSGRCVKGRRTRMRRPPWSLVRHACLELRRRMPVGRPCQAGAGLLGLFASFDH